jgi:hypothetical protein
MNKIVLAALPLALAAAGCATITRGSNQAFTVESEPSGAHVSTSLGLTCDATPCTFPRVSRESEFQVTITKPGYRTWTGNVSHSTAGGGAAGMAGNVILGGLIGAAVDANSGATQDLVPNPLRVTLEAEVTPIATEAVVAPEARPVAPADSTAAPDAEAAPAQPQAQSPTQ